MTAQSSLWQRTGDSREKKYHGRILHKEFADRLNRTADTNPNVPPMRSGRLTYIRDQLAKRGADVSLESVRKWFSGEAKPHESRGSLLAQILHVDEGWLLLGAEEASTQQQRRVRNAEADAAVNLVAAFVQWDGGVIAFPEHDDRYAVAQHVDLTAVIRGAAYPLHIVVAEERENGQAVFSVPTDLRNTVPIGVLRLDQFSYAVYEITDEAIELGTPGRQGKIEVSARAQGVREIESFKDRF